MGIGFKKFWRIILVCQLLLISWISFISPRMAAAQMTIWALNYSAESGKANSETIIKRYFLSCQNTPCFWHNIGDLTAHYGPTVTLDSLLLYKQQFPVQARGDSHEWAHLVGHQTAKSFGVSGKSFLTCPTTFNYGCQHGFFEEALSKSATPLIAIDKICGKLEHDPSYSQKFKFYCYHGVGHGVMQEFNYDLKRALGLCDSLPTSFSTDGCWQGVFMENINGWASGKAPQGDFLSTDPLAPCDQQPTKYQHECYINQSAYILHFFNYQVNPAAEACKEAAELEIEACVESIGLMVTNDSWQDNLKPSVSGSVITKGWEICQNFPDDLIAGCLRGGVDHILQMDELNISRANQFCTLAGPAYSQVCYSRIGRALRDQTTDRDSASRICSELNGAARNDCKQGTI